MPISWHTSRKAVTAKIDEKSAKFLVAELGIAEQEKLLVLGLKTFLADQSFLSTNRLSAMRTAFNNLKLGIWP